MSRRQMLVYSVRARDHEMNPDPGSQNRISFIYIYLFNVGLHTYKLNSVVNYTTNLTN